MFSSKKDIDRHVKTSLNKLPENERYLRGLAIARQYFRLNEFASAEHWLSCYLSVQEDSAPAHKLLGQCYEKQRKFDRAITSYQRSLQLDSKQTGLITEVCKLLLMDENLSKNLSKAKHWCDLAESERINHEAVLNLKLKVANKDATTDKKMVKDIILKEIIARPLDPSLRVRLVDYFIDEKKLDEAFKYCFELEMKFSESFLQSIEWTNGVANLLAKYSESPAGQQKHWNYYLLLAIVLDRQIYLNLLADSTMETIKRSNMKEVAHKLYELDQTLRQVAEKGRNAAPQKQMAHEYLRHYRGQLLLYSASLLFKGTTQDQTGTNVGRSRDTTKKCLALLLLAYQCGVPDPDEQWLKQSNESTRHVMAFWNKQAAFRCCQAGSTVLSCVEESVDVSVLAQIQSVTESKVWTTADDLINQVRQLCSDPGWRKQVFRSLYPSGDPSAKASSASYFVQDGTAFGEPLYVLPKREQLDLYLELAQPLYPSSLPYLVYLGLVMGTENLSDLRCKAFPRLNFSTNNLDNCNLETLNQLDMDSFLYCAILVAQSNLDGARQHLHHQQQGRPSLLPAANLIPLLCEDNKIDWWSTAYHLIRSSTAKDAAASVAEQRQLLQHGLQAIRGTGAPLCDVIVLLKLGQVLAKRASGSTLITAEERRYVECRAEAVYRAGVLLWKIRSESSSLGTGSGMFFKYGIESYDCQQETVKLAETAITFLASVYFKHGRYEEFTQDFGGIPLPFAAYFRAEAFRKLDESNKTPLKAKKFYSERARECIRQTQRYLELPYIDRNHPLNFVVQNELKRLSSLNDSLDGSLNTSANGGAGGDDSDQFQSFTSSLTNPVSSMMLPGGGGSGTMSGHGDRDTATAAATAAATVCLAKTNELESLIRQMMETLTFVKEDVLGIRNDVGDMQDRLVKIEENIYRKPFEKVVSAAATAAAMQAMNDMYLMDEFQNNAAAAAAAAAYHQAAAVGRLPPPPQTPYHHALYGANAYPNAYLSHVGSSPHQQVQMLASRGHPMGPMGASPMHQAAYQHPDSSLLVAAAAGSTPPVAPTGPPAMLPAAAPSTPNNTTQMQKQTAGGLSIEQSLQTPALLSSWNSTYNNTFNIPPSGIGGQVTASPVSAPPAHHPPPPVVEVKGGAPVNVVITSSDPLPPPPSGNSSTFASGTGGVQPTYSVTIPPQHIKHSNTGGSIGQGTTGGSMTLSKAVEAISPAASSNTTPQFSLATATTTSSTAQTAIKPVASVSVSSPSFFANLMSASPAAKVTDGGADDGDDDDDVRNVSGGAAEYDPRPDFQPIIPLPDEIVVRTGEEDEEQMFTGRSKLLRLVDREWKERGLGELKILRSKADPSKYRIVMRREQVHKICANHYITPELIIKPMEKRPECYIWAAMDFADEQPRKESFCARFGTAELAKQFHDAFVAARNEVARLRGSDSSAGDTTTSAPPPTTTGSFTFSSTPKSTGGKGGSSSATTTNTTPQAAPTSTTKPFGEFTFAKNYTPPAKATGGDQPAVASQQTDGKPSPFASFTFKAASQQVADGTGAAAPAAGGNVSFGNIFGSLNTNTTTLGFEEKDFKCAHEASIVGLKRKDQPQAKEWTDCGVSNGNLRLLTSPTTARLLLRKPAPLPTVCLNQILAKGTQFGTIEKNGCSWTVAQDAAYPMVKGPITFAAFFQTGDERDRFLTTVQNTLSPKVAATTTKAATTTGGFGDLFKPKSGSWDCGQCYVNNKADASRCLACDGPRDPSKKDDSSSTAAAKPKLGGGLFGSLVPPADGGSKFTFGMPQTTAGNNTAPSLGVTKKDESVKPATPVVVTSTPAKAAGGAGGGFGDKFKPKPGAWTCNGCYLSNAADTLYCLSCEAPKDDTVPKKSANAGGTPAGSSSVAGLLKAADTMPKFNFTAGGGFTFGAAASAAAATSTTTTSTGASTVPGATSIPATTATPQAPPPAFGGTGGFTFGSPMKPANATQAAAASQQPSDQGGLAKPVFKFELPTPAGGLSFGSKLTSGNTGGGGDAISKLDPPEKATFGFVFKPKSPGRTLSGGSTGVAADGGAADDDGAAGGDNSVTEEENNTYFAPVIPLPDKVEVKTGEEDEDILYAHRAKLYRFVSSEWKERGIGDVKILKHKETGKLRVVMRREQVLKICLNHALTEDVCYSKKDDKSWQFVANDFSEGAFELMNFCLRFKSADIAQEFRDAITDALSGKLTGSTTQVAAGGGGGKSSAELHDSTITSTTSPGGVTGELNFSKLSDISLNDRETAQKLKLPDNFFDCPATTCAGCRGCDPDAYVFPTVDSRNLVGETDADEEPLPIDIKDVKPLPRTTPALAATSNFLSSEQKSSSPFTPATSSIFSGSTTTDQSGGASINNKLIFGSSTGVGSSSAGGGGSIFSASLNTTPKTSFVSPPSSTTAGTTATGDGEKKAEVVTSKSSSTNTTVTSLLQQATLTTPSPAKPPAQSGGSLFGSVSFGSGGGGFGSAGSTTNIFGGSNIFATPPSSTTAAPATNTTTSPAPGTGLFGSVTGFGDSALKQPSVFGGSGFTFGGLAKQANAGSSPLTTNTPSPFGKSTEAAPVLKMDDSVSFAALASNSPDFSGFIKKGDEAVAGSGGSNSKPTSAVGGFVGLTVKEDFFSRSAAAKLNSSAEGTGNNGNADDSGAGEGAGAGDENYDPYYAPVIQLPDEIEVRTGEEEESKLFGDRAKLYRYDSDTKEWKERGVGELKVLHHPVRNTYRLLLRREQIHKLVLNHAITAELAITPMNNSAKAFMWGAMNHAESPGQLEKLAVRFKNEAIADQFRGVVEQCQESLRSRPDLEPDQD
ncbi:AGAP002982-PA-like protein [Anopheles sinensis]|uniref:AGAP002982-PA-like protein n=1 Tax=Anopheles sinensis TaxID=74873 RepID=A0A084VJB7_ANOSI|nr:AGAP002982-PA-like protein [Anopheles sinensis]